MYRFKWVWRSEREREREREEVIKILKEKETRNILKERMI